MKRTFCSYLGVIEYREETAEEQVERLIRLALYDVWKSSAKVINRLGLPIETRPNTNDYTKVLADEAARHPRH